jgi:hypothetical protein
MDASYLDMLLDETEARLATVEQAAANLREEMIAIRTISSLGCAWPYDRASAAIEAFDLAIKVPE